MPPRLQLLSRAAHVALRQPYQPLAPFLYPVMGQQRSASILSDLRDVPGAYNKRIRRGRGPASGKGKTSGRGHKGQGQHGKVPAGFTGGQTPDEVVAGKRGEVNIFSVNMAPINLNRIQLWIDKGRLDPTKPITLFELNKSRCLHGAKDGVKLLARGKEELRSPIHVVVSRASAEAIAAVERLGGTVTTRYYSPFAVSKIMRGEMDPIHSLQSRIRMAPSTEAGANAVADEILREHRRYKYRLPDPARRKDIEYYRDPDHRGYLSHLIEEGQGPSLFFKRPGSNQRVVKAAAREDGGIKASANRVW